MDDQRLISKDSLRSSESWIVWSARVKADEDSTIADGLTSKLDSHVTDTLKPAIQGTLLTPSLDGSDERATRDVGSPIQETVPKDRESRARTESIDVTDKDLKAEKDSASISQFFYGLTHINPAHSLFQVPKTILEKFPPPETGDLLIVFSDEGERKP